MKKSSVIIRLGHELGKLGCGKRKDIEMPLPTRRPGESWDAFLARANKEIASAPERNLSTNAPLVDPGCDQGSRDQGIKACIVSKPDQGVFDSTDTLSQNARVSENTTPPEDKVFLDRYGDIIGVVNGHPLCVKAVETWGNVFPQALTNHMKELGISRVIDALRFTANYRAAKQKDKFFWGCAIPKVRKGEL